MLNTANNQKRVNQITMQRTSSDDLSDDEDEDKDVFFMKTFHRNPTLLNDDLFNVSQPFSNTFNRQHLKQQTPMAKPQQNMRATQIPLNSRFSRLPELLPMTQTKRNTIVVNGQSSIGRDTLSQNRSNFSLKKNTVSPFLRKSCVSVFQRILRYIFVSHLFYHRFLQDVHLIGILL